MIIDTEKQKEFPWMRVALREIGVKELPGEASNPRIVEYLKAVNLGLKDALSDETPWCSAFVNWCLRQVGIEGTNNAWARSWLNWGKRIEEPVRGCITILKRGEINGHVGFFIRLSDYNIWLLGGNQNNRVSIAKYPIERILGYRLPL